MIEIYTVNGNVYLSYKGEQTIIKEAGSNAEAEKYIESLHGKIQGLVSTEKMSSEEMLNNIMGAFGGLPAKERKLAEWAVKSITKERKE